MSENKKEYNNYNFCGSKFKDELLTSQINYLLAKTNQIFDYENLPDTIPKRELELTLQTEGYVSIQKINNQLYALTGGLGGVPNEYNEPTQIIITNPYLKYNKTLTINKDCVIIKNDAMRQGLLPLFKKYCGLLTENTITMRLAIINNRIQQLISASDDKTKNSADLYIQKIIDGELSVVGENAFFDGVKMQNSPQSSNQLTQIIELEQYLKASLYNEIGLNANFNMKREALNSAETELNKDVLLPLINNMLECRQIGVEKVNKMFNTNIKVKISDIWNKKTEVSSKNDKD